MRWSSASGSALTARSLLGILSLPLSLTLPCSSLMLSLSQNKQTNQAGDQKHRHKKKNTPISKSCACSSLHVNTFMEKGTRMGDISHLEKLSFIPPGEDQRAAERRGTAGYSHFVKPSAKAQVPPYMRRPFQAGPLATVSEITESWQHRFDMNMQIRIFKLPTSCFWIYLKIQPLTMTNKK